MIKGFLGYVEIKTKITSIFAFLLTIAYLFYREQAIDWTLTTIFFTSMFVFDLTTTAINNYIDSKTNSQPLQFTRRASLNIIYVLLAISVVTGLILVIMTDLIVLFVGGLCFLCGVLYTYGPVPISRQPLGELLSGVFYGLLIPFLILYINSRPGYYLVLQMDWETLKLELNIFPFAALLLLSISPVCTTANIMLANNVCDMEKDIKVKRHTLPYYIGVKKSLYLFAGLYYACYLAIIIMVVLKILPPICLLSLLTIFTVQKNIKTFFKKQEKESTFMVAINNYIIIMASVTLLIFIGGLLNQGGFV